MSRALLHLAVAGALAATAACSNLPGAPAPLFKPQGEFRPGEVVVDWAPMASADQKSALETSLGAAELPTNGRYTRLSVPDGTELAACRTLQADPAVAVAEPNFIKRTQHVPGSLRLAGRHVQFVPNDSAYNVALNDPSIKQDVMWGVKAIHADQAWDTTQGDSRIKVAVIDTGVDMTHPDLIDNLDTQNSANFLESGRAVIDDFGHGTHVAGIVAAVGNNAQGIVGVAFKTKVMAIRVLGVDGSGSMLDVIDAINYAVAKGCKVINMSLGSPDRSELESRAIQDAVAKGVVVVAAAGNEATTGNYTEYPASYPGVVSVGAVGPDLKRAPFSNFNSEITLVAPGVDIYSTLPTRFGKDNPYGYLSGTSMAAPMVAGVAALVLAVHPTWTPDQVVTRLKKSCQNLAVGDDTPDYSPFFGDGLIDASQAVR